MLSRPFEGSGRPLFSPLPTSLVTWQGTPLTRASTLQPVFSATLLLAPIKRPRGYANRQAITGAPDVAGCSMSLSVSPTACVYSAVLCSVLGECSAGRNTPECGTTLGAPPAASLDAWQMTRSVRATTLRPGFSAAVVKRLSSEQVKLDFVPVMMYNYRVIRGCSRYRRFFE